MAACIGATWIAVRVVGAIELLARSLGPGGSSSSARPTGGSYLRWKRQIEGAGEKAPGLISGTDLLTELNRLRKENKRLKTERDI